MIWKSAPIFWPGRGDEILKYYQQQTFDGIGLTLHATWTYVTLNVFGSFIAISDFMEVIWSSLGSSQQTFRNLDIIKPPNCAMETFFREYHHFTLKIRYEVGRERSACLRTCLLGHSSRYYCMIHNVKWPENLVGASLCKVWNDVDRWAPAEGREYEAGQSGQGQGRHTMGNGDGKLLTIIQIQIKMALIQSFCLSTCAPLKLGWLQWKQVKVQQGQSHFIIEQKLSNSMKLFTIIFRAFNRDFSALSDLFLSLSVLLPFHSRRKNKNISEARVTFVGSGPITIVWKEDNLYFICQHSYCAIQGRPLVMGIV